MLINLGEILKKYNIQTKGIIHVGAHWAEEHDDYLSYGINKFVYVEPCKDAYSKMIDKFSIYGVDTFDNNSFIHSKVINQNIVLYNCACGANNSMGVMYASSNNQGQSNSLLEPNLHLQQHPEVVFDDAEGVIIKKLDNIMKENYLFNILAMDVQGYEGEVLKGATQTLQHIDLIYTEVNRGSTYKGNMLIEEMDEFLFDYQRVETYWPSPNWTWGDACYIKKSLL